ncbi:MAG: hypothetical protein VR70_08130 [Rhodospirillaceae bacterium BRH_c57]|nr:MAG: hypothetical protein VR70_08130 [Rhodospirillaceae bacterium BRH_c57]
MPVILLSSSLTPEKRALLAGQRMQLEVLGLRKIIREMDRALSKMATEMRGFSDDLVCYEEKLQRARHEHLVVREVLETGTVEDMEALAHSLRGQLRRSS